MKNNLSSREQRLYQMLLLSVLNAVLKNSVSMDDLGGIFSPEMQRAILTDRNQRVVEYIQEHPEKTIVIPYGALHFDGIFASLQKMDPEWKVVHIDESVPYPVFP